MRSDLISHLSKRMVGNSGIFVNRYWRITNCLIQSKRPYFLQMDKENKLILYKDDEGKVNVNVRFADEDVWLTRENLAEIYATTPQNISLHIGNIYQDKELSEEGTRKKFFLVRQEGKRQVQREILHNGDRPLCVIICLFALSIYTMGTVPFV